jgi:hypothetical protein
MATSEITDQELVYRTPEDKVRPGDIVRSSPTYRPLKALQYVGANATAKGGLPIVPLIAPTDVSPAIAGGADTRLLVPSFLSWGVLVTRGCDVDHSSDRQIVWIRPLSTWPADQRPSIIEGKVVSLHYLPESKADDGRVLFPESAVDFRVIVTLHKQVFDTLDRPVSLTPSGLTDLRLSWLRHTLGAHVPTTEPCPQCGTEVDVFRPIEECVTPVGDY